MNASSRYILLVESDPDEEALTLRAFRKSDISHEMFVVHDGVEVLDFLFCTGACVQDGPALQPELILLGLKLRKIDGLEVLRRIRGDERTRLLPVVILATSSDEQDIASSYRLGANSYICKPMDFGRFSEAVRQLGLYWLTLNQSPRGLRRTTKNRG